MTSQTPNPSTVQSNAEHKKLDRSFIKGIAWTGASKYSVQIFTWVATLISARLLTPSDYGLMGMSSLYMGLIVSVSEFGFGSAIVTLRNLSDSQIAQINTLSILLGAVGFLITWFVAAPLGRFFDAPDLPSVITVMGLAIIFSSLQIVPTALLKKEYRFKAISIIWVIRALVQSSAVVVFAWFGFRYWSLALGSLIGCALSAILTFWVRRHWMAMPNFSSLTQVITFSGRMVATNLAWYAHENADNAIVGRILGQTALGSYRVAWDLACAPLEKVTSLICGVTPAFYSSLKDDHGSLRRYLLKPIGLIALVIFPAMIGMSLVANDAVPALIGPKWEDSIPVLQLLSFFACGRSIVPLFQQVLVATNETKFVMWNGIITLIVLCVAFIFGSRWGIVGIAAAWAIAYPVTAAPLYWKVHRKIGLAHTAFFQTLLPAINGSLLMALAVLAVKLVLDGRFGPVVWLVLKRYQWDTPYLLDIAAMLQWLLDGHFGHTVRLLVQVVCGGVVYVLAIWTFHREWLLAFRQGLANIRK